jgi:hypothetical protein
MVEKEDVSAISYSSSAKSLMFGATGVYYARFPHTSWRAVELLAYVPTKEWHMTFQRVSSLIADPSLISLASDPTFTAQSARKPRDA